MSIKINGLFSSGIIRSTSREVTNFLNAINYKNIQSVLTLGLKDSDWKEPNIDDTSNTETAS